MMHRDLTPTTREHPWHLRRATSVHHERYRNLSILHSLTGEWLAELGMEKPKHLLRRGGSPEIIETLWMLDSLAEIGPKSSLDPLLDDTWPEDVLGRMEHAVHAVQAWTLSWVLDKSGEKDAAAARNQLEQVCWRSGRETAQRFWPTLPIETRTDLRALVSSLRRNPLIPHGRGEPYLIRRALPRDLQLELRLCPHRSVYAELKPVADALCSLHANWVRGFLYALNPRVTIEHRMDALKTCEQRWCLPA